MSARAKKPRETKADVQERVAKVRTWMLAGASATEVEQLAAKDWQVTDRQARRYMEMVRAQLKEDGVSVEQAMLLATFRKASTQGKFAQAIAALKELAKQAEGDDEEIAAFEAVGGPSMTDGLANIDYAMKVLAVGLHRVVKLRGLTTLERLDQIRKTSRAMASLVSDERRYDAEDMIKKDAAGMDDDDGAPELEDAPPVGAPALRSETAGAATGRKALRTTPG